MRISDWSSDVCSSDLAVGFKRQALVFPSHDHLWDRFKHHFVNRLGIRKLKLRVARVGRASMRPHEIDRQRTNVRVFFRAHHVLGAVPVECLDVITFARGIQPGLPVRFNRSEEHTSELQSLMRISYAVFCLKQKTQKDLQPWYKNQ